MIDLILGGMRKVLDSNNDLGDRSTYIGASDLDGCPRKVLLGKVTLKSPDIQTAIFYQRGHMAEEIVFQAMKAQGWKFERQVELKKGFIKAHLDLVFENKTRFHIIEVKTGRGRPNVSKWKYQLQMQMGLARQFIKTKKAVTLAVCWFDLTEGVFDYLPVEFDQQEYDRAMERAEMLWQALGQGDYEASLEKGPLCGWCDFIDTCPLFSQELPELDDHETVETVRQYLEAKREMAAAKDRLKDLEQSLKDIAKGIGRKVKVGEVSVFLADRKRLGGFDEKLLRKELGDALDDYRKPPTFYQQLLVEPLFKKKQVRKAA